MNAQRTLRRSHLLRRNRSSFRQQGHPVAQAGAGRLRHPVPAAPTSAASRCRRRSSTSAGIQLRDRPDARRGVGRDGRAPARGARQPRHRQRHRRAELAGSADHGRQRGAVRLPDSGSGREEAAGAAQVPEDRCGRSRCRAATSASRSIRRTTSRSPTASASTIRCCGISRGRCASPKRRSSRRSRRRGRSLPQGSRDAAAARPGARRLARERDRARRDRRAQQRAALRGRVRPPQDSRRDRRPGAGRPSGHRPPRRAPRRPRAAHRVRGEDPRGNRRLAPGRGAADAAAVGAAAAVPAGSAPRLAN